eukprot:jgi/Mesen1/737/ME000110S_11009
MRLRGKQVAFITGTDEHGEKIAVAAAAEGRQPKEHCNLVAEQYSSLWATLDIAHDRFVRTTQTRHEQIVEQFFQRVWDKGDIYRAEYEGLYCVASSSISKASVAPAWLQLCVSPRVGGWVGGWQDEKELLEGDMCPTHRKPCQHRKEDNFFFALSKYQAQLEHLMESNPEFVRPSFRRNEVRGYLSALLEDGDEVTLEAAVAKGWPASVHIIGKDILRFHAVYWPAMLMSAGLELPSPPPSSELTEGLGREWVGGGEQDGLKMGKSVGNTLEPTELVAAYGSDAVRYFFLRDIEFGKDGDFAHERFVNIVNANLANTIGNLLNRTLGLLTKNCQQTIPADAASIPADHQLRQLADAQVEKAREKFESLQFGAALEAVLDIANAGNLFLDERAPWSQFKKGPQEHTAAALDLLAVLEAVRIVAVALSPVTPQLSRRIYSQLAYSDAQFDNLSWVSVFSRASSHPVFEIGDVRGGRGVLS